MELSLKPAAKNTFPISGILIADPDLSVWLYELQRMQLDLSSCNLYPIPGNKANTIWGCLITNAGPISKELVGKNELCQQITSQFYIPEYSTLYPSITEEEMTQLFSPHPHLFHPVVGLVELEEQVDFEALLIPPIIQQRQILIPAEKVFIPNEIKSFQIVSAAPETVLENMEEQLFPQPEQMKDRPLNILEKLKLAFYKLIFQKSSGDNGDAPPGMEMNTWWSRLLSLLGQVIGKGEQWMGELKDDFRDLDDRNKKQLDKLMELFKKNPEEALKYAIPLDHSGAGRGNFGGNFTLSQRWWNFSLFSPGEHSGGTVNLSDGFADLERQYNETANALKKEGKYEKAAFIYLKLLKQYFRAAETLEEGCFYREAAAVYLKHGNNVAKAALCYEKGNLISEAIGLYESLQDYEKAGDLYLQIYKRKEADIQFQKVVDNYSIKHQFVKAAMVCRNKMLQQEAADNLLLRGWRSNQDAVNCLSNYFAPVDDPDIFLGRLNEIYEKEVSDTNRKNFLHVLRHEFKKRKELTPVIQDMAYEIVSKELEKNPSIVSELNDFTADKQLTRDTIRFSIKNKK